MLIKFTKEQSIPLLIEYTRYRIYCDIIKGLSHKAYFVQQSLERFVLDCINEGDGDSRQLFLNPGLDDPDLSNFFRDLVYNRLFLSQQQQDAYRDNIRSHNAQFLKLVSLIEPCEVAVTFEDHGAAVGFRFLDYKTEISHFRYGLLEAVAKAASKYELARLILRYSIFEESGQQWSIGSTGLYYNIAKQLGITAEMFASPFNFLLPNYCSLMPDTDTAFGSMGSFFNMTADKLLESGITGVTYNPPYPEEIMSVATPKILEIIADMDARGVAFNVISFLPNWQDADYIQDILKSRYKVASRVYRRGDFMLQDKWSGKMFKGTFNLLVIILSSRPESIPAEKTERILSSIRAEAAFKETGDARGKVAAL